MFNSKYEVALWVLFMMTSEPMRNMGSVLGKFNHEMMVRDSAQVLGLNFED